MGKKISTQGEYGSYNILPYTCAGDKTPIQTWKALKENSGSVLVDVRTDAELNFVGEPDLSFLEKEIIHIPWVTFPSGQKNSNFLQKLRERVPDKSTPTYFICRSGVRSLYAAALATKEGYTKSFNVSEGFEGSINSENHRGTVSGWKVSGLPWCQD